MPRLAAGPFRLRRFLHLLRLVGLLQLVGLRVVRLGRELGMITLVAADDLAEVLVRYQALLLHLFEDLTPPVVRRLLLARDLVQREWRGSSTRVLRRALRLEQGSSDLL